MIDKLCIIGVGLIGGSLARALRAAGACKSIIGCGRDSKNLEKAIELGVIDEYSINIAEAVVGADMIVVCVPLGAMEMVFQAMNGAVLETAIITDAGSAKRSVVASIKRALGTVPKNFIPAHPIAGTEKSGVGSSFAELYQRRKVILTPLSDSSKTAEDKVRWMWQQTGANVISMDIDHHDEVLAATSHLPHLLAYGIVDTLASMDDRQEIFEYAAGGFRDFTRIASSDPVMWRDICIHNKDAISSVMDIYIEDMKKLAQMVKDGDGDGLHDIFVSAKQIRDKFNKMLNGEL